MLYALSSSLTDLPFKGLWSLFFNILNLSYHSVFRRFIWFSEGTAIATLNSIH